MSGPHFIGGNRIELLECGAAFFPALCAAIDAAHSEIHLQTYIYEKDESADLITTALKRAAARGVKVCVMVDGFGGRHFVVDTLPELSAAGVEVLIYRREIRSLSFPRRRLRRLHRKVAVIDAAVAFVGGINIIDDQNTPGHIPPRFDYAVKIEGPLLGPIYHNTYRLWWMLGWATLRERPPWRYVQRPRLVRVGDMRAAFIVRDNLRHRRSIEEAYLAAIEGARSEVLIACAYFLPGRRFRQALIDAAQRGANVVLLLQGRVEYALLHYASRALYSHLLSGGVRIFEYHTSFLHAKVGVVDEDWATVGSSNIDPFSLLLAREANVVVRNKVFTCRLRSSLADAMDAGARELLAKDWRRAPRLRRIANWLAFGLVRMAMGLLGIWH
ncbi:MAG: cardiolipin synthase ClsB [Betaproteobacteria bacterium]|nr:cardiolipin synthase ClsB [Betaproteobacteria bacterium]